MAKVWTMAKQDEDGYQPAWPSSSSQAADMTLIESTVPARKTDAQSAPKIDRETFTKMFDVHNTGY